jgi:signal recognition particle GTPase
MGDVVSLVEKAQETYNQEEAVKLQKKWLPRHLRWKIIWTKSRR